MSVAQTKSRALKAETSRSLKAQLKASLAEPAPPPYKFPAAALADLKGVRDELVLDLKGMADALWAMSYCDLNCGFTGGPLNQALQWVQRELETKAQRIEDVTHTVVCEINQRGWGEL